LCFGISRQTQRLADLAGQALVQCNAREASPEHLATTRTITSSNEQITCTPNNIIKLPILHGRDVPYALFHPPENPPTLNEAVAGNWQKYLMEFVLKSNPNLLRPETRLNKYGDGANVIQFDFQNIATETADPFKGPRCDVLARDLSRA